METKAAAVVPTCIDKIGLAELSLRELGQSAPWIDRLYLMVDTKQVSDANAFGEVCDRLYGSAFADIKVVFAEIDSTAKKRQARLIERGFELAQAHGYTWALCQDDDAFLQPGGHDALRQALATCPDWIDLISPARLLRMRRRDEARPLPATFAALLAECDVALEGTIAQRFAWWFTGQPKLVRVDALLQHGTGWREFSHYWWWDVALSWRLEASGGCASLPIAAMLIEHARAHDWMDHKDANAEVLERVREELKYIHTPPPGGDPL